MSQEIVKKLTDEVFYSRMLTFESGNRRGNCFCFLCILLVTPMDLEDWTMTKFVQSEFLKSYSRHLPAQS